MVLFYSFVFFLRPSPVGASRFGLASSGRRVMLAPPCVCGVSFQELFRGARNSSLCNMRGASLDWPFATAAPHGG